MTEIQTQSSVTTSGDENIKVPLISPVAPFLSKFNIERENNPNQSEIRLKIFKQNERHNNGGWKFIDDIELKKQRGVCWSLVKSVGNSIIEGKELTSTCLPIELFEARSFLEKVTDTWGFAPLYLNQAADTKDPVERLKLVVSFIVSGLHLTTTLLKPFNPLLGETFECDLVDGAKAFCEQISHHPPISSWKLNGPQDKYIYTGNFQWSASCRGNVVKGCLKGPHSIEFKDGTIINFNYPDTLVKGIFWSDRVTEFAGKTIVSDEKNGLSAEIIFNPNALGFVKSLFSKQKTPSDTVSGRIYKSSKNTSGSGKQVINDDDVISNIDGTWLTSLVFGSTEYWNIKMIPYGVIYKDLQLTLPTDSSRREDIQSLKAGNIDEAKKFKALIEDKQRTALKKDSKKNKENNK